MQYGVLHVGGMPIKPTASPVRLAAGHFLGRLGRPSRLRSRALMITLGVLGTILLFLGRRNVLEIQRTASSLGTYVPSSIADIIAQYGNGFQDTRWDDDVNHLGKHAFKKPKFHLLVPASKPTANLCKTLLSAAILNYPPPTLVSYGTNGTDERPGLDLVKNTFNFLIGRQAHDDDLLLIVEEDAWFQLPAEVAINRFFHGMQDSSDVLLEKYGRRYLPNGTLPEIQLPPKFTSKVLFGAAKECSNLPNDPACMSAPQSPLPKDIYGPQTDKHPEGKYNRPRFMGSSVVMGRVTDLRPIYKHATEMLAFENGDKYDSQHVFCQIFGEQEFARSLSPPAKPPTTSAKFRHFLSSMFKSDDPASKLAYFALQPGQSYEYGITLDYFSSIFQVLNNSVEDVRFVTFNHPSIIASPSKLSAASFANPIHLPADLNGTAPPFAQHVVSALNPDPPITALDTISSPNTPWSEVELATNVIVPGSSVPASLNFHGNKELLNSMWANMWFYKNSRALMRQYIRSPDGPIAAEAAMEGGDKWWDLRGGKGGVWTDRGEWLEWNEVCGEFDEEVFADGKGEFGQESEELGGQGVKYDSFGNVVSGKVGKGRGTKEGEGQNEELKVGEKGQQPVGEEVPIVASDDVDVEVVNDEDPALSEENTEDETNDETEEEAVILESKSDSSIIDDGLDTTALMEDSGYQEMVEVPELILNSIPESDSDTVNIMEDTDRQDDEPVRPDEGSL